MAAANGEITNGGGVPSNEFVLRTCTREVGCAYYQGIQGTSMASPHVAGVAALVVDVTEAELTTPSCAFHHYTPGVCQECEAGEVTPQCNKFADVSEPNEMAPRGGLYRAPSGASFIQLEFGGRIHAFM